MASKKYCFVQNESDHDDDDDDNNNNNNNNSCSYVLTAEIKLLLIKSNPDVLLFIPKG